MSSLLNHWLARGKKYSSLKQTNKQTELNSTQHQPLDLPTTCECFMPALCSQSQTNRKPKAESRNETETNQRHRAVIKMSQLKRQTNKQNQKLADECETDAGVR